MFSSVFMITFAETASEDVRTEAKANIQDFCNKISQVNITGDVLPYAFGGGDYFVELDLKGRAITIAQRNCLYGKS